MRKYNYKYVVLLLLAFASIQFKAFGQDSYKGEAKVSLDKYYRGLNSYIVNQSVREALRAELGSVFRNNGAQSIVQNDLNLLNNKNISTQTSLDEYLVAVKSYANKSEREGKTFKIEFELLNSSYNESRQYVNYLNKYVTISTIDINKIVTYGSTRLLIKDHVILYDGLIEKIESTQRQAPPPTNTNTKKKRTTYIEWPWDIDFYSRVMGFSMGYVQKKVDFYYTDDSKETTDLAWNYKPNDFTNGLRLGLHFQPCFSWGLGLYTGLFFEYYYSHTPSSNKVTTDTEDGLLADAYTSFSEKAISVPLHLYFRVPFSEDFALSLHGGINADYLFGAIYKDKDGYWMTYTPSYGTEFRYDHFNLEYAIGAGIQYEWALIEAIWFNGITKNEKFSTPNNYSKALLTGFSISFSILPDLM